MARSSGATSRGLRWLAVLACALAACGAGELTAGDPSAPSAGDPSAPSAGDPSAPSAAEPGRDAFVGGARCADCHPTEALAWRGSHHDLAMQVADEVTVHGDFADATLLRTPTPVRFSRRDGRFVVRIEARTACPPTSR